MWIAWKTSEMRKKFSRETWKEETAVASIYYIKKGTYNPSRTFGLL